MNAVVGKPSLVTKIYIPRQVLVLSSVLSSFISSLLELIDEIRKAGKTILLVSHALGTVQQLCDRCLLLNGGKAMAVGETEKVLAEYGRMMAGR